MPLIPSPRAALHRLLRDLGEPRDVAVPANYDGPACATPNCQTRRTPWQRDYLTVDGPDGLPTLRCIDCATELYSLHGFTVHH